MATDVREVDANTIEVPVLPPDIAMHGADGPEALAAAYGSSVDSQPAVSPEADAPTFDQLMQGTNEPAANNLVGSAQKMIQGEGHEMEFRGFDSPKFIMGYRTITGEPVRLMLHYNPGRTEHDFGRRYWMKRHPQGNVEIPQELWGKPIFMPRPPAHVPRPLNTIKAKCAFCEKDGFPSEDERMLHMQKKHSREFGTRERDRDRKETRDYQSAMAEMVRGNQVLMASILEKQDGITDEQRESLVSSLAEASQAADVPAAPVPVPPTPAGTQWVVMKHAEAYYRLKNPTIKKRIEAGDIGGYKNEKDEWRVLIPSATWTAPEE